LPHRASDGRRRCARGRPARAQGDRAGGDHRRRRPGALPARGAARRPAAGASGRCVALRRGCVRGGDARAARHRRARDGHRDGCAHVAARRHDDTVPRARDPRRVAAARHARDGDGLRLPGEAGARGCRARPRRRRRRRPSAGRSAERRAAPRARRGRARARRRRPARRARHRRRVRANERRRDHDLRPRRRRRAGRRDRGRGRRARGDRRMTMTAATFQPFLMERWQSLYEHEVEYNLADSAVRCAPLELLLDDGDLERLARLELFYPPVNGSDRLRERIAATYTPQPPADEVLVTVGAAEANALVCQTLLEPGDRVPVIEPGYRQVRGLAENAGCAVDVVQLRFEDGWELDPDALRAAVGPQTKLVCVVNPNNPTGTILSAEARAAVIDAVDASGAWLLADEVYRGSERDGAETESFWGAHPRVVCVNSLSKAYGLCGLRVGWVVAPQPLAEELWRRHEYAVISTSL